MSEQNAIRQAQLPGLIAHVDLSLAQAIRNISEFQPMYDEYVRRVAIRDALQQQLNELRSELENAQ